MVGEKNFNEGFGRRPTAPGHARGGRGASSVSDANSKCFVTGCFILPWAPGPPLRLGGVAREVRATDPRGVACLVMWHV